MGKNIKLYLGLLLDSQNYVFISNLLQSQKADNLFLSPSSFYFLTVHLRLSTLFYSTQLVDIFSYEAPTTFSTITNSDSVGSGSSTVIVYNYHVLNTHNKLFVFVRDSSSESGVYNSDRLSSNGAVSSISELFSAAN